MKQQISALESMRRLDEDIARGYPEQESCFVPWSSSIGKIVRNENYEKLGNKEFCVTGLPMWMFVFFVISWEVLKFDFTRKI